MADVFVSAIAEHAAALEPHYILRPASAATQALLATKKRQYEVADENGLAVPRTATVNTVAELQAFAETARFPCLMKPLHFREWQHFAPGHPLLTAPNTVLTPHLGYGSQAAFRDFYRDSIENVLAFLDGNPVRVVEP